MRKREYQEPTMKAVQLQHWTDLLQSSGLKANRDEDYGDAIEETWQD